jgi:hypothetical protein
VCQALWEMFQGANSLSPWLSQTLSHSFRSLLRHTFAHAHMHACTQAKLGFEPNALAQDLALKLCIAKRTLFLLT